MPLTDIILVLNSYCRTLADGRGTDFRYVWAGNRVFAYYGGLRLQSRFLPVREPESDELRGHEAWLEVDEFNFLAGAEQEEVFALPADGAEAAELDRRVCTLHALNHLLLPERGILFLRARHGDGSEPVFAFEDILRPCGLLPEQVQLEWERAGRGPRRQPHPPSPGLLPIAYPCRC